MEIVALKKSLPALVRSLKDWFSLTVSIKLFGVEVFKFEWPPVNQNVQSDVVASQND